jgi:hypothetical protein
MKPIQINKNSWHYKIVNFPHDNDEPKDLCSYLRNFVSGVFLITCVMCLSSIVIGMVIQPVIALFVYFQTGYAEIFSTPTVVSGLMLIALFSAGSIWYAYDLYTQRKEKQRWDDYKHGLPLAPTFNKPDGFIKLAYKSFKEKTCLFIEFK